MQLKRIEIAELLLSLLGVLISAYLTAAHYASFNVACPVVGIVNCETVLNSSYAVLFGVPLAVYGVAFFSVMLVLVLLRGKKAKAALATLGIGFVAYFLYLEYLLGHICLYCTATHLLTLLLFVSAIYEVSKEAR